MIRLSNIADLINARVIGSSVIDITNIASLETAKNTEISFLSDLKLKTQLTTTKACAVILTKQSDDFKGAQLIVKDPYLAFAKISQFFNPVPKIISGIHPTATIVDSANIAKSAQIAANVVIGERVLIENNVYIGAGCVIADDCKIGKNSRVNPNSTILDNTQIGENCIIHSNVVIGGDGFGFARDKYVFVKIPQIGSVIVGNNVEIGSGTTIDCGALDDTIIGDGVKLDNQIQIGHNVIIGNNTAIAAATAVAGSAHIGNHCQIGGACAITGHIKIADGGYITSNSLVSKSTKTNGVYSSSWVATDIKTWQKMVAKLKLLLKNDKYQRNKQ